jgi:hypothetical protein
MVMCPNQQASRCLLIGSRQRPALVVSRCDLAGVGQAGLAATLGALNFIRISEVSCSMFLWNMRPHLMYCTGTWSPRASESR